LTIIVDDRHGHLPLNPTKQDLAWSEHAHGEVFKANVEQWITAVAKTYYGHHFEQSDKKKGILTERVQAREKQTLKLVKGNNDFRPIAECIFTKFSKIKWTTYKGVLRAQKNCFVVTPGRDTHLNLPKAPPLAMPPPRESPSAVKKMKSAASTALSVAHHKRGPDPQQVPPAKKMRADGASGDEVTRLERTNRDLKELVQIYREKNSTKKAKIEELMEEIRVLKHGRGDEVESERYKASERKCEKLLAENNELKRQQQELQKYRSVMENIQAGLSMLHQSPSIVDL
jgi:hypothetical protein